MGKGDTGAGDLSKRMNARVRPPRAMDRDRRTFEPGERLLEQSLNRFAIRLTLPADKPRPVVGEGELQNSHRCHELQRRRASEANKFSAYLRLCGPGLHHVRDPGFT